MFHKVYEQLSTDSNTDSVTLNYSFIKYHQNIKLKKLTSPK